MHPMLILLVATVLGWMVQGYFTYKQSMAFNTEVRNLRRSGTVSVGVAGKRYRGGRVYIALAVDDRGVVRDARSLSGWTTFARAKTIPALLDVKASKIRGEQDLPGLTRQQREAAREAATSLKTRVAS